MSDQFGLFAPPPAPSRLHGHPRVKSRATWHELFFAFKPDPHDAARIANQAFGEDRRLEVGGKMMQADRLHVSLFDLGGYATRSPEDDVELWMQSADAVRVAPFEVVFDRLATFGGATNPLVLKSADAPGIEGVLRLHEALGEALANTGKVVKDRAFAPHMTVSYEGLRIAETPTPAVRFTAGEFVLIDSHVGQHVHEVLWRWPLRA
jgi:2'-5' RNA ligase